MKLTRLRYQDLRADWGFEDIHFHKDVTLLVGASGVGKTRILQSIRQLRSIATGNPDTPFWGIHWSADFEDATGVKYLWSGSFENRSSSHDTADEDDEIDDDDDEFTPESTDGLERNQPRLNREELYADGKIVFERSETKFYLHEKPVEAKLSAYKSGLSLLSEEDKIQPARASIAQMLVVDELDDMSERHYIHPNYGRICNRLTDLESIRKARLPTPLKLALVYENDKEAFEEIIAVFRDIFPYIEKVIVERSNRGPFNDVPVIKMKESGVASFFSQHVLSSGMRRTLMHLARLSLWPDGTLVLVDEFENSLGSNCIDTVADGVLQVKKRLQFILTSHHPYIINTIPTDRWKIIARDKGTIKNYTPEQLGFGRSRHTSFTQLINTETFKFGTLPNELVLSGRGAKDGGKGIPALVGSPAPVAPAGECSE